MDYVAYTVLVFLSVLLGYALYRFLNRVSVEVMVDKDMASVRDVIKNLENWSDWNPWFLHDPHSIHKFHQDGTVTWCSDLLGVLSIANSIRSKHCHAEEEVIQQSLILSYPLMVRANVSWHLSKVTDGSTKILLKVHSVQLAKMQLMNFSRELFVFVENEINLTLIMLKRYLCDEKKKTFGIQFVGEFDRGVTKGISSDFFDRKLDDDAVAEREFFKLKNCIGGDAPNQLMTLYNEVNISKQLSDGQFLIPLEKHSLDVTTNMPGGSGYLIEITESSRYRGICFLTALFHLFLHGKPHDRNRPLLEVYSVKPDEILSDITAKHIWIPLEQKRP